MVPSAAMVATTYSWRLFDVYQGRTTTGRGRQLEAMREGRDLDRRRIVQISTLSVHGREASGEESLPSRPIPPPAITKFAPEQRVFAYDLTFALPVVVVPKRCSSYGPGNTPT